MKMFGIPVKIGDFLNEGDTLFVSPRGGHIEFNSEGQCVKMTGKFYKHATSCPAKMGKECTCQILIRKLAISK